MENLKIQLLDMITHQCLPDIEFPKIKCSAIWLCHTFPFAHELAIPCLARLQKQRDHMQVSQNGGTPQSSSKSDSTIWILKPMATWGSLILWTLHRSMSDINVHPTSSPPAVDPPCLHKPRYICPEPGTFIAAKIFQRMIPEVTTGCPKFGLGKLPCGFFVQETLGSITIFHG